MPADCGSRCVCFAGWTGACCETRRPGWAWGDPHLQTLDGKVAASVNLLGYEILDVVIKDMIFGILGKYAPLKYKIQQ